MASELETSATDDVQSPARRSTARHAAPRLTVRGRFQLPVGRALALTAVPTALLMGSLAPKFAFAAESKAAPVSAPPASGHAVTSKGVDCSKDAKTAAGKSAGTASNSSGKHTAGPGTAGAKRSGTVAPAPHSTVTTAPTTAPSTAPDPAPSRTRTASADPLAPVTDLLNGLTGLGGHAAAATAAPRAAAATAPAATSAPTATATAVSPVPTTTPVATPTGGATAAPTTRVPAAPSAPAATTGSHRMCDASRLAAPLVDTGYTAGQMPMDAWTLKSTDLKLTHTEFHGVKSIELPDKSTVRVLMFTADTIGGTAGVDIGNLDMSVKQNGQRLHVRGGPGTTSTMTGGQVTMYVTSLSGTLKAAEGIPLGWLNINLTLTPDSLPDWLFNLVGDLPIPLSLEFSDATVIQQGQFGGDLTIPGMHLYYTPLS